MLAVIPARGGSKTVRRKNLAVVDGKPLLCHIADALTGYRVVVSTDDPEIRSVALTHGYEVVDRPDRLAGDENTVIGVAAHVCVELNYSGPLIVAQPTCPYVTAETIQRLVDQLKDHNAATLVTPNTHLLRDGKGPLTDRVNRQELTGIWREIGVRAYRSPSDLNAYPTGQVEVQGQEAFDIDTLADLSTARHQPKRITFQVAGNDKIGSGHIRRCLLLADELQHHDIEFSTDNTADWGNEMIDAAGWHRRSVIWPSSDVVIVDTLDTTESQIGRLKAEGFKVVTLEDRGPGARLADLVVNALYPAGDLSNEVSGPDWADLRPEFIGLPLFRIWDSRRILCLFGGTDPAHLGERIVKLLTAHADVTWCQPGDDVSVAYEMMNHDLLVTSAGRTVYEAAAVGIPTVVIAQNQREAGHAHLGNTVYLGLGRTLTHDQIVEPILMVLADSELRADLSETSRAAVDGLGVQRIVWRVEGLLSGLV